jgi:hypothetical protein
MDRRYAQRSSYATHDGVSRWGFAAGVVAHRESNRLLVDRNAAYYRDPAAYGLFEVDPAIGESSVRKLQLPAWYRPSWSPDGTQLALDTGATIIVADEQATTGTSIIRAAGNSIAESPAWRP